MVTEGGSSKRLAISIHWGLRGGGQGNYTTLLTYFAIEKRLKVKCQEYRSGSRECNVREAGGLHPSPLPSANILQKRTEVISCRHYIVCQEML